MTTKWLFLERGAELQGFSGMFRSGFRAESWHNSGSSQPAFSSSARSPCPKEVRAAQRRATKKPLWVAHMSLS